jgi:GT2 family glycosyltransferase
VWLLNNDANVEADALVKLVQAMRTDDRCGAVSPVIIAGDANSADICSCTHDWKRRCIRWAPRAESVRLHQADPSQVCLLGTAIMLRVKAIRDVGLLDERLFAYYDDNDIGARLTHGGWRSKVVFDAGVRHGWRSVAEQPLYYFYLMYRNELMFWHKNMPQEFRKLLWLKIVNQALFNVNRLRRKGLQRQADSALLGVADFICGRGGPPDLGRKVPLPVRVLCRTAAYVHRTQLGATDSGPLAAA